MRCHCRMDRCGVSTRATGTGETWKSFGCHTFDRLLRSPIRMGGISTECRRRRCFRFRKVVDSRSTLGENEPDQSFNPGACLVEPYTNRLRLLLATARRRCSVCGKTGSLSEVPIDFYDPAVESGCTKRAIDRSGDASGRLSPMQNANVSSNSRKFVFCEMPKLPNDGASCSKHACAIAYSSCRTSAAWQHLASGFATYSHSKFVGWTSSRLGCVEFTSRCEFDS